MNALQVIKGIKKELPDYAALHLRAEQRAIESYLQTRSRNDILRAVNHGVRAVVAQEEKKADAGSVFSLCERVTAFIRLITPRELMQIFPVEKTYDGERWGTKDYFFTMEAIKKHGIDKPLGENVDYLLWDYMNPALRIFQVTQMSAASDLYRQETGKGIMETLAEENGIRTYIKYTDDDTGKEYLYDEEADTASEIKKPIPRYMKLVSGGKGVLKE